MPNLDTGSDTSSSETIAATEDAAATEGAAATQFADLLARDAHFSDPASRVRCQKNRSLATPAHVRICHRRGNYRLPSFMRWAFHSTFDGQHRHGPDNAWSRKFKRRRQKISYTENPHLTALTELDCLFDNGSDFLCTRYVEQLLKRTNLSPPDQLLVLSRVYDSCLTYAADRLLTAQLLHDIILYYLGKPDGTLDMVNPLVGRLWLAVPYEFFYNHILDALLGMPHMRPPPLVGDATRRERNTLSVMKILLARLAHDFFELREEWVFRRLDEAFCYAMGMGYVNLAYVFSYFVDWNQFVRQRPAFDNISNIARYALKRRLEARRDKEIQRVFQSRPVSLVLISVKTMLQRYGLRQALLEINQHDYPTSVNSILYEYFCESVWQHIRDCHVVMSI